MLHDFRPTRVRTGKAAAEPQSGAERDCCAGRGQGEEESCCGQHGGHGERCCSGTPAVSRNKCKRAVGTAAVEQSPR